MKTRHGSLNKGKLEYLKLNQSRGVALSSIGVDVSIAAYTDNLWVREHIEL